MLNDLLEPLHGAENGYILKESVCHEDIQKRYETEMCLGNGYIGMRSAFCEECRNQERLTLIAGLYDQQPNEEEELAPLPDVTHLLIRVNGTKIDPLHKDAISYERSLDLRNGLLDYSYDYAPEDKNVVLHVEQRRFVSMQNKHLVVFETLIHGFQEAKVEVTASINGRQTVDGTQHFFEEERTVLPQDLLWYGGRTVSDGMPFRTGVKVKMYLDGNELEGAQRYATTRRLISTTAAVKLEAGSKLRIVRYALLYTQHDDEWGSLQRDEAQLLIQSEMKKVSEHSFDELLSQSETEWSRIWNQCDIKVKSVDPCENLKIRLALYHMIIMCPSNSNRVSVAAKGLTGMGYAGHVFWDCEIFNLPFYTYTLPEMARNICTYRYRTLQGAREKAKRFGFRGAMYPWESASEKGVEQSPRFKNYSPDNTPRRVTCGDIEHHVVCDVAYGIYEYCRVTDDWQFMEKYGLQILFETADFWQSRLNYNSMLDRYEILQVTGPDEYKEYVDNDVFTNYMVAWNLQTALNEGEKLKRDNPKRFQHFDELVDLQRLMVSIEEKLSKLYLPKANQDGLIPQNDTYLGLKQIDLTKYKESKENRLIYKDYSLGEIAKLMVSKQPDLIQLIAMMPHLFDQPTIRKNYDFYEDKCIHDSTLSKSIHALASIRMGDADRAYKMLRDALDIDFGKESYLCDAGIHGANCGGIWQAIVFGFAGLSTPNGILCLEPALPDAWEVLEMRVVWRECKLLIQIDRRYISVKVMSGRMPQMNVCGQLISVENDIKVDYLSR